MFLAIYGILKIHYPYESFCDKRSHDKSTNIRKMADAFKNCSNFTIEQTDVIAHVRGVSAAVCCAILSTVLVVLVILAILPKTRNRLFGTVVKRLSFGLIAASVVNGSFHVKSTQKIPDPHGFGRNLVLT